jgi:MFS family permease
MIGSGETYLSACAIFLKGTIFQVGILGALPQLVGALCQILAVWILDRIKSRRWTIVLLAYGQIVVWGLIAVTPFFLEAGSLVVNVLILLAAAHYMFAGLSSPVWNSLMGDLVPREIRGTYFGHRNRYTTAVTFASMLLAGGSLALFEHRNEQLIGFFVIFLAAAVARAISAYYLLQQDDPKFEVAQKDRFTIWQFISSLRRSNFAKFVLFGAAMSFSVWISAPYYSVYMLRDLKLSYAEYTILTGASIFTQLLTFRYWGTVGDRFGNKAVLGVCGSFIAVLPFFWVIWDNFWFLLLVQFLAGVNWAGYNLATANFVFDAVSPSKLGRCVAYQATINGFFVLFGSVVGAWLTSHGATEWTSVLWVPPSVCHAVFLVSGLCRLVALAVLAARFKEVKEVEPITHRELIFRIAHIRSIAEVNIRPITSVFRRRRKGKTREDGS